MRKKLIDITGKRFGRLIAIKRSPIKGSPSEYLWECICDCGNIHYTHSGSLRGGRTKSCGCYNKESKSKHRHNTKLGKTLTYSSWAGMIARCKRDPYYYIERQITVCDRWLDFTNFLVDMGECPEGLTIERVNNNGNYEPENCCWATQHEQNMNKRHGGHKNKRSGLPHGVYHNHNKFRAFIKIKGTRYNLGAFSTPEEAAKAVDEYFDKYAPELKPKPAEGTNGKEK